MSKTNSLKIILAISVGGLIFSGYLSYNELFAAGCSEGLIKCSSEFSLYGLPACVYGFLMYLALTVTSIAGLIHKGKN